MDARTDTLPSRELFAYGALGLPLAMAALPIYVHVPQLYAGSTGMSLGLLGGLLLAARLLDAGVDPLLGVWSDRAPRRQCLILLALPFLAFGLLALLHPPAAGGVLSAPLWLLLSMAVTYFGFSLASIAYQAWGAELGRDAGQRTRLVASREGFGLLGVVLAAALPGLLSSDPALALSWLAWGFLPLLVLLAGVTLLASPPTPARVVASEPWSAALRQVLRDARFRRLLMVFVVNGIAAALPATLVLFFIADVLQAGAWSGAFLSIYFVSGVAFLPLWVALARRFGRVPTWLGAMLLAVFSFIWAWGLGAGDVWPFAVVCLLSGAALGADLTLPAALLAGITQSRSTGDGPAAQAGGYFGCWNLVAKLNLALAAGLALPLLDLAGYRPGTLNDAADAANAVLALSAVYCLLPVLFKLIAIALAWRWRKILETAS